MAIERLAQLGIGARSLPLPVYFPSVSTVKTILPPMDYLQFLSSFTGLNGQFLVSAFDLSNINDPLSAKSLLATARQSGAIVLMDSGNYESFWKNKQASWKQADFHKTLEDFPCDLAFSFDEQSPPSDHDEHVALVAARWRADSKAAGQSQVIPILHADAIQLPALCTSVASETGIIMIAVAERKLGDGILERARTVRAIRTELNKLGRYVALHLLGTGNPISISIYTAMGADSFDGLEWCQTVVDHDTGLLYHLSQSDFFAGQTTWGDANLSFHARALAHNLDFFEHWMRQLRSAVKQDRISDFCRLNLPALVFRHCSKATEWNLS